MYNYVSHYYLLQQGSCREQTEREREVGIPHADYTP